MASVLTLIFIGLIISLNYQVFFVKKNKLSLGCDFKNVSEELGLSQRANNK
jgi:hypothetical protein